MSKRLPSLGVLTVVLLVNAVHADPDVDQLRPGLIATHRDASGEQVMRLEPTVALALGANESAHPSLAPNGGTVRWQGYINVLQPGEYRFTATLRGRLKVRIGSSEVLTAEARGNTAETKEGPLVKLAGGVQSFDAEFTRLPGIARVELHWQGPGVYREPIPNAVLFHDPKTETEDFRRDSRRDFGRFLVEERGCANCHTTMLKTLAERKGPDLSQIGSRAYPGWIDRWLADPHWLRNGTAMPQMFTADEAGRAERYAVSMYLASLGGPIRISKNPSNPKDLQKSIDAGKALFTSAGCILCHADKQAERPTGAATIHGFPLAGVKSTYPLGALGSKKTPAALAAYLSDPLAVNPHGRMPNLLLKNNEETDLARYLCERFDTAIPQSLPAEPAGFASIWQRVIGKPGDASPQNWKTLGRELMATKGCLNCHELKAPEVKRAPISVAFNPKSLDRGCLADAPAKIGIAPVYELRPDERNAIREFLTASNSNHATPAPAFAAEMALRRFNCLACHQRDGEGGLTAEQAEAQRRYEKAENAEAASPPPLTGIGHKLLTPALRAVLVDRQRVRPWMSLRMPHYGSDNVGHLADALTALEGAEPAATPFRPGFSTEKLTAGRTLIGKGGFGCISCHDFAGTPNTGTRGPDLTLGVSRLRYDWYRRWLEQPQRMQPGTRMPSVFTDGQSLLNNILAGHADAQAEAMWAYCANGTNLPPPDGLEPPAKALAVIVRGKPVVLRTFMPEAGSRAVAVGYPGGLSMAFDMATARLAYAWSGNFLDAAPVWGGRGGNPAKPLGSRFWTAPAGTPWGLGSLPPDFTARVNDPAYGALPPEGKTFTGQKLLHFDGYDLGNDGAPRFHYRIETGPAAVLRISERIEPLTHPAALGFARRFDVSTPVGLTAWFLAAQSSAAPRIFDGARLTNVTNDTAEIGGPGRLLLVKQADDRMFALTLAAAPPGTVWHTERQGKKWDVMVKLPAGKDDQPRVVTVHVWSVASDDPELLRSLMPRK